MTVAVLDVDKESMLLVGAENMIPVGSFPVPTLAHCSECESRLVWQESVGYPLIQV